jgi:ankyrin repeat protein
MANTADDIFNAISAGDTGAVARLMETDSNLARARNELGVSALMQARYANQVDIVALLRNAAGELDIFEAAALGDVARLQALLANGPELVNSHSNDGFTPLHLACFFGQQAAAKVLILAGADPNAISANRIAVLHSAAASRDAAMVKLVLQAGARPNTQQQGGYTALQSAAVHNNVEMVRALLDAGADRSIANDEGLTAADMAVKNGAKEVAALLTPLKRETAAD